MIVDASALIAIVLGEDDADELAGALDGERGRLFMSPVNYFETWARIDRESNWAYREALVIVQDFYGIQLAPTSLEQAVIAKQARREYGRGTGHPAKLNMGDCFAYALAKTTREPLLFKGDDFVHTDVRSAL